MARDQKQDEALAKEIKKLRDSKPKKTWAEVSDKVGEPVARCMLLYEFADVKPSERISGSEAEVGRQIVKARDKEKQSWARIMARTGQTEGFCRRAYEEATGKSTKGHRIGKGGRYPDSTGSRPRKTSGKAKTGKKAPAKKTSVRKVSGTAKKRAGGKKAGRRKVAAKEGG